MIGKGELGGKRVGGEGGGGGQVIVYVKIFTSTQISDKNAFNRGCDLKQILGKELVI